MCMIIKKTNNEVSNYFYYVIDSLFKKLKIEFSNEVCFQKLEQEFEY